AQGYATDFVGTVKMLLADITSRGIRIVANAGGVNPRACAAALSELAMATGSRLEIAVVEGDDVSILADTLRSEGTTEMFSGAAFPEKILSANAYLGAAPIAAALGRGADIV
ncbi:acyclic terpene utilization AtuA family protein, partial [Rhizobiaceae sp. 2RAB30]